MTNNQVNINTYLIEYLKEHKATFVVFCLLLSTYPLQRITIPKYYGKVIASLNKGEKFSGEVAFKLYDTYGFPIDLTQDAVRDIDIEVDIESFNLSMEKQKRLARNAWTGSGEKIIEQLWIDLANNLDPTEFLGYNSLNSQAKILAIVIDGNVSEKIENDRSAELIFNQSPFYAESGGQVSDTGIILSLIHI